jgi:hypothetical protein
MIICSNKNLVINQGLISLFDSSIPSGFTRFSSLDNKFPRGNSTYGGSSGVTVHFHEILATVTDGPSSETTAQEGSEIYTASSTHTHTINHYTQTCRNIPNTYLFCMDKLLMTVGSLGYNYGYSLPPLDGQNLTA